MRLAKLKETQSLNDIADLLGYKPSALSYILYKIPEDGKYVEFEIPKKNGKKRKIKAPVEKLKHLQKRLADLLNKCFSQISDNNIKKSLSHGFRENHSIVTNAKKHKNKRYVFNVDLQDFFPSINFGRVRGYFIKNHHFELEPKIATIIAQIACHNNELPQGSPCSPIISNLVGHLIDIRMVNLAKKTKCTYSRYADDLTFSTNNKIFPEEIAIKNNGNNWTAGEVLKKEIEKVGFNLNEEKTSMQFKTARQITTGLVVNKKINTKIEYYKNARSMCNNLFNNGEYYFCKTEVSAEDGTSVFKEEKGTVNQLEGILSFIYRIKRPYDMNKKGYRRNNPTAITKLYRKLLFYKKFYSIEMPMLICEGKTDIIYLKTALKQLCSKYNEFIDVNDEGVNYKIGFMKFTKNIKDVFAISTGTSGLINLMEIYESYMKSFKDLGRHPVVFVIDNDDGAIEFKKKLKIDVKNGKLNSFYHVKENAYVLIVPKGKNGAIEDLFDREILNYKVDGKVFNREKNLDKKKEYSKIIFAKKVVEELQKKIDFKRFEEVFDGLKAIIEDYRKKKSAMCDSVRSVKNEIVCKKL